MEYIAIPKLGMSMTEATLVEWKVRDGERVEKGQPVLLIETEKTQWEVEAAAAGFVHVLVPEEQVAPVSRVVGLIVETEEELEKLRREPPGELYTSEAGAAAAGTQAAAGAPPAGEKAAPAAAPRERIRISPVARKMAEEHLIDITKVKGSGPGGRIVREDIERAIAEREKPAPAVAPAAAPATAGEVGGRRVRGVIPLKSMRRSIAEHMQRSLAVSAQLTQMGEIDMTEVKKLRQALVAREAELGARISYTDILVLATARVLREFPIMNSSLVGDEIRLWEDINIGVAVAVGDPRQGGGLIVPVVRNADRKGLLEINRELAALVEKARDGKLLPDDVAEGTFTITNLGAFGTGYGFGTPIINQPQSAILGTGAIVDRPVVKDGAIVVRPVMTYSLTFDHRVIDGAPAAMFMMRLAEVLENPGLLLATG